jgi:hypothetical protein
VLHRTWDPGDRVMIRLPMSLGLSPVDPQHPERVAVTYGPVVLVRNESPRLPPGGDLSAFTAGAGGSLVFTAPREPQGSFLPFYKVDGRTPYNMYFDLEG